MTSAAAGGVHCAVVGSPIAHSRSPILHRAAYAALSLSDWSYERVELRPGQLAGWLSGLDESWRAVSVTMPIKQEALAVADSASELASSLGVANTLIRAGKGWHADNTDVSGLLGAIGEVSISSAKFGSATVVGAGATAVAALAAMSALGLDHVDVVLREPARGRRLLAVAGDLPVSAALHGWSAALSGRRHDQNTSVGRSEMHPLAADLVISTVPAGATADLIGYGWHPGQTVVDVTYEPWPTALVTSATDHGATAVGGAAVLLWQAVGQIELMTGLPAPVEEMRAALLPGGTLAQV